MVARVVSDITLRTTKDPVCALHLTPGTVAQRYIGDYEIVAEVGLPMGTLDLTFCPTSTTGPFIILARTKTATQPNASQNMHAVWHISLDRLPAHQLPAFPGRHAPADPTMVSGGPVHVSRFF
jgi:hypothetical protein